MPILTIRVGSTNIQNLTNLNDRDTKICTDMIAKYLDAAGCQETIQPSDNAALLASCPREVWDHAGTLTENDTLTRKSVLTTCRDDELPGKIVSAVKVETIHGGIKSASPHRTAVRVASKFTQAPHVKSRFGLLNGHWVSGVHAAQTFKLAERKIAQVATVEYYEEEHAWYHENGLPMFATCDTNWHAYSGPFPKFHPDQEVIAANGIDKIWYVPANGQDWVLKEVRVKKIPNPSDHDLLVAECDIWVPDPPVVPKPTPTMGELEREIHAWAATYQGPPIPRTELAELFTIVKGR